MKLRCFALGFSLALLAAPVAAQGTAASKEARAFFEIGAKAYKAANYVDAAQAFEEAYQRSQRPGLLFSLGQAHRMEFFARGDAARLKAAIRYYREYLAKDAKGKRRADATEALSKLTPILARMEEQGVAETAAASTSTKPKQPRVMISSTTPGVSITLDGKKLDGESYVGQIAPGRHRVVISAPGYRDFVRDFDVVKGSPTILISRELDEKPARLTVRAPEGAEISVNGRFQGVAPMTAIELSAGRHFVAVTMNGREAFTEKVELVKGERRTLAADLESTGQRTTAWVMMGVGAGGLIAGGVLGVLSLRKESDAQEILDQSEGAGGLPASELARYESLRDDRNRLRLAGMITGGAGLALGAVGFALYAFDEPKAPLPPAERGPRPAPGKRPEAPSSMEVSVTPLVGPGFTGGALGGRF